MDKKILIFIDWYRPGYKAGGPVTSVANLVDRLVDQTVDHRGVTFLFHIITRNHDYGETVAYEGVESDRWVEAGKNVRVCYMSAKNLSRRNIIQHASEAGCDTWYVTGIYSWYFSILPLLISWRNGTSRLIVSTRGMFSSHALAVKGLKKRLFIGLARLFSLYRNVTFHATNKQEKEDICRILGNRSRVHVAPNLPSPIPAPKSPIKKSPGALTLINPGRISPEKNTLAALEILNAISAGKITGGHIHLHLAGQVSDPGYWEKCLEVIGRMPPHITIEYHGPVPPGRLPGLLHKAHFLFMPTTGENHGHAILECLSHGLPVIISDRTPWTGLEKSMAGWAIPLNREEDFENVILECLQMDQEAYNRSSEAAGEYARRVNADGTILEMNQKLFVYD